ncbi:putative set domain-containing protein [Cyclospora cayetanensis]|uniref:Set domain-containing protein n=1 Tax=Cyclospora cayetanensis TaxID=88456 RepID=A0A1D3CW05_9EIME|nr:putative set domain-containing protein [Cyclospora cayetanensis]
MCNNSPSSGALPMVETPEAPPRRRRGRRGNSVAGNCAPAATTAAPLSRVVACTGLKDAEAAGAAAEAKLAGLLPADCNYKREAEAHHNPRKPASTAVAAAGANVKSSVVGCACSTGCLPPPVSVAEAFAAVKTPPTAQEGFAKETLSSEPLTPPKEAVSSPEAPLFAGALPPSPLSPPRHHVALARISQGLLVGPSSLGRGSGLGVYCCRDLPRLSVICEYSGVLIDRGTALLLRHMRCASHVINVQMQHLYLLGFHTPFPLSGGGAFVNDGRWRPGGGEGPGVCVRFKVMFDRYRAAQRVVIVALKDIRKGTELLTSYDNDYWRLLAQTHHRRCNFDAGAHANMDTGTGTPTVLLLASDSPKAERPGESMGSKGKVKHAEAKGTLGGKLWEEGRGLSCLFVPPLVSSRVFYFLSLGPRILLQLIWEAVASYSERKKGHTF